MAGRFFEQLLVSGRQARRPRGRLTLPVSIVIHAVVLAGVLIVPLVTWGDLPEPENSAVLAFFVEPAAAPPPPPPPPAPPKAAMTPPRVAPKVVAPKPTTPKFTAPVEVPDAVPDAGVDLGSSMGVPGGVEGGVVGGVEGGVVGGVLGGIPQPEAVPPPPPPPTTQPPAPKGPVRVGGQVKEPSKLRHVAPQYPDIARQARVQGMVVLEALISRSGEVQNVRVIRGVPLLNDAAVAAVRQWRYTPTTLNGVPVPVVMTVTVNFTLGA